MDLKWYPDLIICITSSVAAISLVVIAIVSCLRYRRTKHIADAIDRAVKNIDGIITNVREDVIDPLLQIMSLVKGIRQGIEMVNKFVRNEGERKSKL